MTELKAVGAFLLFIALVIVAVNVGKLAAGAGADKLPSGLVVLLGGTPPERAPLSEVHGA